MYYIIEHIFYHRGNIINMEKKNAVELSALRWGYLTLCTLLLLFLGLIYAWSVFRIPLETEFGWAPSQASLVFSVSMMLFCLGGLVSGMMQKRFSIRVTVICSAVCMLAGFSAASMAKGLVGICCTYSLLCGLGVGLGYNACLSVVMSWFPDKKGLVSGIALMGFGFGGMVFGTLSANLIGSIGWRKTFLIFGLVFFAVILIGAFILKIAPGEFAAKMSAGGKAKASLRDMNWKEMIRQKQFWLYFIWAIILSAAGLAIMNEAASFAQCFVGDNLARAAALAGMVSIANGVGRIIFGQLFDKIGYRKTMIAVCAMFICASAALLAANGTMSIPVLAAGFIFLGLAYGGVTPTNSAYASYFFGSKNYAFNFSLVNLNLIIASYLGPACGSLSYSGTFLVIMAFAVIGIAITIGIKEWKKGEA